MESYNNIGIDSSLDWKRIRKLFKIGVFAAFVALAVVLKLPNTELRNALATGCRLFHEK